MKTSKTRKARGEASKASKRKANGKAAVKRSNRKAAKPSKVTKRKAKGKARQGGGKALSDFANTAKLRLLKPKEIPARRACFKTGQTVSACLAAQKEKGFRGRRKFIRAQIAQGRVSVS